MEGKRDQREADDEEEDLDCIKDKCKDDEDVPRPGDDPRLDKFDRRRGPSGKELTEGLRSKPLARKLFLREKLEYESARRLAEAEILLTEPKGFVELGRDDNKLESMTQGNLFKFADIGTREKLLDLNLSFGPYIPKFSKNGRQLLLGGRKGAITMIDMHTMTSSVEINVRETVRDVCILHNETLFAAARKKHVYVYDNEGIEIHCIRGDQVAHRLEFLPYHFLLVSVGDYGVLRYQDISTGRLVAEHKTKLGHCMAMTQNPQNGIIHLGHSRGAVTLWTPNDPEPIVTLLAQKGPVGAVAVDGRLMATGGQDGFVRIWDLRNQFKELGLLRIRHPVVSLEWSQSGLLGVAMTNEIFVYSEYSDEGCKPMMQHKLMPEVPERIAFRPFEDILHVGTDSGFRSMLVPGAGEANFDSLAANPFETKGQRRNREVRNLLDKLPAESICLDPNRIGGFEENSLTVKNENPVAKRRPPPQKKFIDKKKKR